jgi:hypothetical protein
MKTVFKRLAGVAAMAALAAPTIAQAGENPASKLSVAGNVRAATPTKGASKIGHTTLINLAIFAVIVGGGLALITSGGNDKPKSP